MSNNIYDIMNKLNAVANKDMPVAKKESTDKTLLESTMKEVLNEKYMGFDKTVAAIKKGGSAKNPEAVAASIGRKKYGKEQFQAAAAQGKKMGEGLARIDDPAYKDYYGDDLRPDTATIDEDDMEEGNLFTGNLAKARAQGKKRADLDGDGDMETVREGAKPDYIDLDKDGNRKESMKKAAADKKKQGVRGYYPYGQHKPKKGECPECGTVGGHEDDCSRHSDNKKKGVAEGSDNSKWVVSYTEERKSYDEKPSSVTHEETMVAASSKEEAIAKVKKMSKVGTHMYGFSARPARKSDSDSDDIAEQRVSEETKETSTGRVHKAGPGGYGRKDDDEDDDKKKDKKAQPAVKRGRGRPKKGADSETGEVKKWDTDTLQSWIVGSVPKKLPGKASVKHKIKDEPDEKLDEKAPPGAKAERMVKHIKKGYAKDGNLTDKEKGIAYATAWKAKKAGKVEESIPPGFPRSLAKKIYEHFDGNVDSTLNAMWNIHNTVMESQSSSKKKLSESMTFEQSTTAPAQKPVMGTYKGGVWTADPPKKGEVGVPVPQNIDGGSAPAPTKSKPVKTQKKAEVDTDTDLAEMLSLAGIKSQVDEAELAECGMSSSPISGGYGSDMHNTDGRMNISTNMSTDGNKSVTITADGDAAAELMQMLKIAGLNSDGMSNVKDGEDLDHPGSVEIHGTMDSGGAEELAKKLRTAELDEAKDKRYHANTTPEEEVLPVQTQLKGGDGEVAGKEKKMKPHGYKFSDNPLSMKESMSLKLMKEYEGIKKAV